MTTFKGSLEQKKWPNHIKYEIVDEGVVVDYKKDGKYTHRVVKFEEMGEDELITAHTADPYAILSFVLSFVLVVFVMGVRNG